MESILQDLTLEYGTHIRVFLAVMRYLSPLLVGFLLWRCLKPLMVFKREPEIWGWLYGADGTSFRLTHWENVIGRSPASDVRVNFPTVSRIHAVLTRYDDGSWSITDAGSKSGTLVNGEPVDIYALQPEDTINIGGVEMRLTPITEKQERLQANLRTEAPLLGNVANLLLLTVFQLLVCLSFWLTGEAEYLSAILQGFGGIIACQWALMIFYLSIHRSSFEVETVAFLLCTMGMAVIATVIPKDAVKQLISVAMGIGFAFLATCLVDKGYSLYEKKQLTKELS